MALEQLIAAGTTGASSADIAVAAGEAVTVSLKAAAGDASAVVELKDDGGAYTIVARMNVNSPAWAISAPGTYRVRRLASGSCGVFRAA